MKKRLGLVLSLTFGMMFFQNCGQAGHTAASAASSSGEQVIVNSTAQYTKVVYDPNLESSRVSATSVRIELDADQGSVILPAKSCALDAERLQSLRDLLASSRICKPAALPPGYASCQAIGLADIQLLGGADQIELRPVTCNYGTFLCDGNDEKLRALIADLQANLPAGCH